jgi:hypothetical protein
MMRMSKVRILISLFIFFGQTDDDEEVWIFVMSTTPKVSPFSLFLNLFDLG